MVAWKSLLSLAALAAPALAYPGGYDDDCDCKIAECPKPCPPYVPECLDDRTARKLAETFEYFFVNLDGTVASHVLTENFEYFSDSDNTLNFNGTSIAPGTMTFASRAAFVSGLPSYVFFPLPDPYVIEEVFHSCHKIAARWVVPGGFGGPPEAAATVRGITVLHVRSNGKYFQISRAYTEYNNLLAAADVGRCDICTNIFGPATPGPFTGPQGPQGP
ncbi:hypothetical protein BT63DRAFT_474560 [Microthyrium microscopicum]|uniref:NTF2-like domain-containing protein n=1 Tax=Microthyrium microscopicum TaxID=703497 RepID=A0A6A6UTV9_9PEZI|nr:hypothetical protein BT63DRAFT_474560 [Microthyrium microscopicum]